MSIFLLVIGLILFVCLVVVHEFGHFVMARRSGVQVEEFGLGFPPRAWAKKMKSGYEFSLNYLPLGGFVRLKGEHDADKSEGSFGRASLLNKTKIMLAGVVMNLLAAFFIITVVALVGMPQLINNQFQIKGDSKIVKQEALVGYIEPNSPASKIGLKTQDQLLGIGLSAKTLTPIVDSSKLPAITKSYAGKIVDLQYKENGKVVLKTVTLRSASVVVASLKTNNPLGYLGISPTQYTLTRSTWSAPVVALGFMKQVTVLTFKGLWTAITSLLQGNTTKASSQVSGPVGIVVLLKNGSQLGYQFMLTIVAVISLSLAIINVLPIPALDGGRLFFTLIPRLILKRPLKQKTEEIIHGSGLATLMLLFVLITIVDIKRFF